MQGHGIATVGVFQRMCVLLTPFFACSHSSKHFACLFLDIPLVTWLPNENLSPCIPGKRIHVPNARKQRNMVHSWAKHMLHSATNRAACCAREPR